ncbi:MAG: hypothetical protein FWE37_00280 [Spirochaetaceae bacterium]|nr:hypothetical protein [Spirochaetaceae bacterium]
MEIFFLFFIITGFVIAVWLLRFIFNVTFWLIIFLWPLIIVVAIVAIVVSLLFFTFSIWPIILAVVIMGLLVSSSKKRR